MSAPHEESAPQGASIGATITEGIPSGGRHSWDIPLDQPASMPTTIPRPAPANDPRIDIFARLCSALAAAAVAGLFIFWVHLAGPAPVNRILGVGGESWQSPGLLAVGLTAGLGAILLMLLLHPIMRLLVRSQMEPRVLEPAQRALLDVLPDPMFFLDYEARLEDVNVAFARALGERPATLIGRRLYQFIGEKDRDRFYRALVAAAGGEPAFVRCPVETNRGPRMFDFHVEAYEGHNSETPRLVGVARDTTDQASADRLLHDKYEALHAATVKTIESISGLVELRDPYLHGHHERVAKIASSLCRQLKLPDDEREGVELAARVHDVGTIKVPFEILIKPDPLTDSESAIIEQHCKAGADILSRIDFPWPIADMVLQHHENFDGSGYPNKLKGSSISLGARILAVADAYDAMISHRPYRSAVSRAEAMQRLTNLSGRIYDPKVVSALSEVLKTATL